MIDSKIIDVVGWYLWVSSVIQLWFWEDADISVLTVYHRHLAQFQVASLLLLTQKVKIRRGNRLWHERLWF